MLDQLVLEEVDIGSLVLSLAQIVTPVVLRYLTGAVAPRLQMSALRIVDMAQLVTVGSEYVLQRPESASACASLASVSTASRNHSQTSISDPPCFATQIFMSPNTRTLKPNRQHPPPLNVNSPSYADPKICGVWL